MKKTFIILGLLVTVYSISTYTSMISQAQLEIPAYAKWSKIAIQETQLKYPHADLVDYLHVGSESNADLTMEYFKLWLKDGNNEMGVFVRITYKTKTEELVGIEFEETSR